MSELRSQPIHRHPPRKRGTCQPRAGLGTPPEPIGPPVHPANDAKVRCLTVRGLALLHRLTLVLVAALVLAVAAVPAPAWAQARRPLLMEGKKTLYQRVLTRPGARVLTAPEANAAAVDAVVPPLSLFYVYERKAVGDETWLQVGRTAEGDLRGWLPAAKTVDWKQSIVVAFNNPAGRERTLLFESRPKLEAILRSEARIGEARELREKAVRGEADPEGGVISIEPETYVDINEKFYILPILSHEETRIDRRYRAAILEVASVSKDYDPLRNQPSQEDLLKRAQVGIVFVVDTTKSMQPYIDRTRKAMERIYQRLRGSSLGERIRFGLIGYRDNVQEVPQLEYLTRTFVELAPEQDGAQVLAEIRKVQATRVSSVGFDEDSMAGIDAGLKEIERAVRESSWEDLAARYIVVIADAGPRPPDDPGAAEQVTPEQMRDRAWDQQRAAIMALHLLTPDGRADHEQATDAYKRLAQLQGNSFYFPVPEGDVDRFGERLDKLADQLLAHANQSIQGRLVEERANATPEERALDRLGRAMQLAYLGRRQGTEAPDLFRAWLVDRTLEEPTKANLEVRLLVTKNQLANMHDVLKKLVDEFEGSREAAQDPSLLFQRLRDAVRAMARDQSRVVDASFGTLGEAAGEFLEGLPYRQASAIMSMDEQRWRSEAPGRRDEIIDGIRVKLGQYRQLAGNPQIWTPPFEAAPPGEHLYPIRLDLLP